MRTVPAVSGCLLLTFQFGDSFSVKDKIVSSSSANRRQILNTFVNSVIVAGISSEAAVPFARADSSALQDSLDVGNFLRTGMDSGGNMGVSSQAGKSRPQTGVILRDGSDVRQDKSGNVFAELLTGTKANPSAVLVSFSSPWKLETGPVFDIETRDGKTGDGAFVAGE